MICFEISFVCTVYKVLEWKFKIAALAFNSFVLFWFLYLFSYFCFSRYYVPPYVGCVCTGFGAFSKGFSPGVPVFFLQQKPAYCAPGSYMDRIATAIKATRTCSRFDLVELHSCCNLQIAGEKPQGECAIKVFGVGAERNFPE